MAQLPMTVCACAIFINRGRLLLAKRAPHKAAYPNSWDVIGGHVEAGETIEQALVREAEEEVGLVPRRFMLARSIERPSSDPYGRSVFHCFAIREWDGGDPKMLGDEHAEIRWFAVADACALEDLALAEYRDVFRSLPPE
jgi:8-oxo-dGTP diphosphatase